MILFMQDNVLTLPTPSEQDAVLSDDSADENGGSQMPRLKQAKTDELPPAKRSPLANLNGKVSIYNTEVQVAEIY